MEGMPRVPMLHPEPKVPANQYDEDFRIKIKEYILLHYQDDPSKYDGAITEIMNMKQTISNSYADVETACILKRYYAQLLMMKSRFPMEEGDAIKVLYCWYDRAMDIAHSATYDDIGFELACVMYNIGAIHASIGINETRENEDSIKNAFMHFQYAAWPLQHLRDKLNASKYASIDFDKELLTFFINVLLGQAQECLLEKSLIDHRSNIVVTKLAVHLRDRYQECLRHLENSNLCDYVSSRKFKLWTRTCAIKSEMYGCIAMVHMGCQADEDKKMGARYGYYKLAEDHLFSIMKLAEKEDRETMKASLAFLSDIVITKLNNAKKENEFIFHERVPGAQELCENLEGLCKVRPLSFDPLDISVGGEDLFGALLPPGVIKAVSEYEEEKDKLKREVLERVNQKDDELNAFLVSLRIDEIDLEADSTAPVFPDMLLERNAALTAQPDAIPRLLEDLQNVTDFAREAEAKLSGLAGRMADVDLPQITSDEGYKAVKKELDRLNEHHQKARSNNVELHKAIAAHTTNLHLLSLPIAELRSKLAGPAINAGSTPEGASLRRLLEKTQEMQTQRNSLVQRLTEEINNDNIAKKLLSERDSDHKETYIVELKKHEATKKYLDANLDAQERILSALTEANADFSDYRKKIKALLNTRSEHIMTLVTAYDVYCDVCSKVQDGRNFYVKLLDRLNKLTIAVEGIETAFGAERSRRDAEKRMHEEKMATYKQANEARDALADFAVGGFSDAKLPLYGQNVGKGDRPRLGDYLKFYRSKMAVGRETLGASITPDAPSMYQQQNPVPCNEVPPTHLQCMPSGVAGLSQQTASGASITIPESTAYFPPHQYDGCGRTSFVPRGPSCAPQPCSETSHAAQPVSQSHPLLLPQQPMLPPSNHVHVLPATSQLPVSSSYAKQQYHRHLGADNLPTPAVVTPIASVNTSLRTTQYQQLGTSQMSSSHIPHLSVNAPQHQIMVNTSTASHYPPECHQAQLLGPCPVIPGAVLPINDFDPRSQLAAERDLKMSGTHPWNLYSPHQQTQTPPDHMTFSMNNTARMTNINQIPAPFDTSLPEQAPDRMFMPTANHQQKVEHVTPGNIGMPPSLPAHTTMLENQTPQHISFPPPQAPHSIQQPNKFTSMPSTSVLPWHSKLMPNVMQSPWHAGVSGSAVVSGTSPFPPVQLQQLQQQRTQPHHDHEQPIQLIRQDMPNMLQNHLEPHRATSKDGSNVDLLGGIPDDSNLPAALIPLPKSMENQNLLQTCAPSSLSSSATLTLSDFYHSHDGAAVILVEQGKVDSKKSAEMGSHSQTASVQGLCALQASQTSRPAAAVMPIQYQETTTKMEQPGECSTPVSSVALQLSRVLPLSDITDPAKFELGPGDRTRLEKRLLHEHIRSGGDTPLPKLDPNDPLNSIDPFWKAR